MNKLILNKSDASADLTTPLQYKNCIVPVCENRKSSLVHKFPCDPVRFNEWINAIQTTTKIPQLRDLDANAIRKRFFVCCRHFRKDRYKNSASRSLNFTSVPHLNIDNLNDIQQSKAWELEGSDLEQSKPSTGKIIILNKNVDQVETPHTSMKFSITTTSPQRFPTKRKVEKYETVPKRIRVDTTVQESFKIATDDTQSVQVLKSVAKPQSDSIAMCTPEMPTKTSPVATCSGENKLLALFNVTAEQYEKLQNALDSGQNIISVMSTIDNTETESNVNADNCNMAEFIEVTLDQETYKLDLFWLRDHCRCDICYDHENHQRKSSLKDIQADISLENVTEFSLIDGNNLKIIWTDQHESIFDASFIISNYPREIKQEEIKEKIFWNKESSLEFLPSCHFAMRDYMTDPVISKKVLESLFFYGVCFIEGVQPTQENTEFVIRQLFQVHRTLFGDMWSFSDSKDHSDTAYTNIFLGPHTDNTYFNDASGLQVLHCLSHNGDGGENLLVDGFAVLEKLKENFGEELFNRLTKYIVPAEYIEEKRHHKHFAPIIGINPVTKKVEQIRFNLNDRAPMNTVPANQLRQFYSDMKILSEEIEKDEYRITFKLAPGTVMIFDNWRILHGRNAYTGKRVMTGCYVSRTEFQSALRSNKIID